MAVAKSYEHMEVITEPFLKNGRKYVRVKGKCDRCGGSGIWAWGPYGGTCFKCQGSGNDIQEVRWYTDKERATQDRQAEKRAEARIQRQLERDAYNAGPEANGFIDGFVIAVLGNTYEIKDELIEVDAFMGFPGGLDGKESASNAGDPGSIPGLGRFPGEGKGYPLQYSGLENSMDCIVHGVAKSRT